MTHTTEDSSSQNGRPHSPGNAQEEAVYINLDVRGVQQYWESLCRSTPGRIDECTEQIVNLPVRFSQYSKGAERKLCLKVILQQPESRLDATSEHVDPDSDGTHTNCESTVGSPSTSMTPCQTKLASKDDGNCTGRTTGLTISVGCVSSPRVARSHLDVNPSQTHRRHSSSAELSTRNGTHKHPSSVTDWEAAQSALLSSWDNIAEKDPLEPSTPASWHVLEAANWLAARKSKFTRSRSMTSRDEPPEDVISSEDSTPFTRLASLRLPPGTDAPSPGTNVAEMPRWRSWGRNCSFEIEGLSEGTQRSRDFMRSRSSPPRSRKLSTIELSSIAEDLTAAGFVPATRSSSEMSLRERRRSFSAPEAPRFSIAPSLSPSHLSPSQFHPHTSAADARGREGRAPMGVRDASPMATSPGDASPAAPPTMSKPPSLIFKSWDKSTSSLNAFQGRASSLDGSGQPAYRTLSNAFRGSAVGSSSTTLATWSSPSQIFSSRTRSMYAAPLYEAMTVRPAIDPRMTGTASPHPAMHRSMSLQALGSSTCRTLLKNVVMTGPDATLMWASSTKGISAAPYNAMKNIDGTTHKKVKKSTMKHLMTMVKRKLSITDR